MEICGLVDNLFFLLKATDDDEPGTNNSHVMYRIGQASSGLENKFQIDPDSGEITLKSEIDYESLPSSLDGRVIVTIVAYDLGDPSKSASVDVTVQVEVNLFCFALGH